MHYHHHDDDDEENYKVTLRTIFNEKFQLQFQDNLCNSSSGFLSSKNSTIFQGKRFHLIFFFFH
jgi:hypothetical protein